MRRRPSSRSRLPTSAKSSRRSSGSAGNIRDLNFHSGPVTAFATRNSGKSPTRSTTAGARIPGGWSCAWGEPASILKPRCTSEDVFDVEVWTYDNLGRSGRTAARYIFYRRFGGGPRRLWTLNERDSDVFYPNACRRSVGDLARHTFSSHTSCLRTTNIAVTSSSSQFVSLRHSFEPRRQPAGNDESASRAGSTRQTRGHFAGRAADSLKYARRSVLMSPNIDGTLICLNPRTLNPRSQRTPSASPPSPLSRKPLGS